MVSCRACRSELNLTLIDLGSSPIANNLETDSDLIDQSKKFPLKVLTCHVCSLVQLSETISKENLFASNYSYYSSYSTSWLIHSKNYVDEIIHFLEINENDLVIEIASNDGYLLQFFREAGINVLGIEPAADVANFAINKKIPTVINYFTESIARELRAKLKPKLILGNNVLAHVPDIQDFVKGLDILLDNDGIITLEFPHLMNLIKFNQFDTIYHEHYSYLSVTALLPIFLKHNMKIFDIKELSTHGGSLRIYVAKKSSKWKIKESVGRIVHEESKYDPRDEFIYTNLQKRVLLLKQALIKELLEFKNSSLKIAAYGAAAKGVTLLNYCGIDSNNIDYVVDMNPHKQGKFLPGSRIPIVDISRLLQNPPDVLLVLPWNLSAEIKKSLLELKDFKFRFLRAIPKVEFF
jgi:2-polyprenyl-3-methyl-5-hydroxy-6-metoxy-1,4-benzoquinol methylase